MPPVPTDLTKLAKPSKGPAVPPTTAEAEKPEGAPEAPAGGAAEYSSLSREQLEADYKAVRKRVRSMEKELEKRGLTKEEEQRLADALAKNTDELQALKAALQGKPVESASGDVTSEAPAVEPFHLTLCESLFD